MEDPTRPPRPSAAGAQPEVFPPPAPSEAPATGTSAPEATEMLPAEEPDVRGTVVFSLFVLMVIFGFWLLLYFELFNR